MVAVYPQSKFVKNQTIRLADAIPQSEEPATMRAQQEPTNRFDERRNVRKRKPRAGCRAEACRQREMPNAWSHSTQPNSIQDSGNTLSPSSENIVNDADTGSLRSHFSELDRVPCARIFLVRKIQRLGLGSADAVQAHFSAYGEVEGVLVAHSPVLSGCKSYVRRLRPSNLAIVIMATASMAEKVHREGRDHIVNGCSVFVEPYERRGEVESNAESYDDASGDTESTFDGGSSRNSDVFSESDSKEACISGPFEYWATDDEGEW